MYVSMFVFFLVHVTLMFLVAVLFQMLYNVRYQQSCFVVAGSAGNAIYFVLLSPLLKVPCFLYSNVYCTSYMFLFRSISLDGRPLLVL